MAHTLTSGATVITGFLIDEYESSREIANVLHQIIGRPSPDVTLRDAKLRTGRLALSFPDETASFSAEEALSGGRVWSLQSDVATATMTFVLDPRDTLARRVETTGRWVVSFGWQEVSA